MKSRIKKFKEESCVDILLLREKLGFHRYRKTRTRDRRKRELLLNLALKKIEEKERDDFTVIGLRKRKLKISFGLY